MRCWRRVLFFVALPLLLATACHGPRARLLDRLEPHIEAREAAQAGSAVVSAVRTLIGQRGGRVDWGASADLIAFSRFRSATDRHSDIYVVRPDGSAESCLTCGRSQVPQVGNDQPAWHPSGRHIVFQSVDPNLRVPPFITPQMAEQLTQGGAGFHNNLWVMTSDGQDFQRLTEVGQGEAMLHPHFSHDGRKLLWTEREREDEQPRGTGGRLRRRPGGGGGQGRWALKVADFVEGSSPRLENVRTYRPRGGDTTFYESHGFSPDDRRILFSASIGHANPYDLDIWTMELGSEQLTRLTDSPGVWDEHAHYSPGGEHIVWISSAGFEFTPSADYGKTLTTELWLMKADGSQKQRLTYLNEARAVESAGGRAIVADNAWNGDGTRIVCSVAVVRRAAVENRILVVELAAGRR